MKFSSVILLLLIPFFVSCDGKDRARYTTKEKLEQSKLSDSFFFHEKYFPEEYNEVVIDTLISNNVKIRIKSYTDMSNNILNDFKIDTIHYKYFYREIIGDLTIIIDDKVVFDETINKSYFKNKEDSLFWNEALMLGIYINNEQTTSNHYYFNVSYCMIESEICKDYNLIIDNNGKLVIEELTPEEIH